MYRRTFIHTGLAAIAAAGWLASGGIAFAAKALSKAAKARLKTTIKAINAYIKTSQKESDARLGKRDFNRKSVVNKYGTRRANNYANTLSRTKIDNPTSRGITRFKNAVARMRKDLEGRKKRIDAEIDRRKAIAKRKPEKARNVKYENALRDESRWLTRAINALKAIEAAADKLAKQLAKDESKASGLNKLMNNLSKAAPRPTGGNPDEM